MAYGTRKPRPRATLLIMPIVLTYSRVNGGAVAVVLTEVTSV